MTTPLSLIAFGGNALLRENEEGTQRQQMEHAMEMAHVLRPLAEGGDRMVLVHGNGPQVGQILIQVEEAVTKVPPLSLDVCVAQSEGSIGYLLDLALRNEFYRAGIRRDVVCLITQVLVDPADPAFREATKPIGPFYTRYRAEYLRERKGWKMVEDSGRGYRKVVPSPKPIAVLSLPAIRRNVEAGYVVIAGGGGGIPVFPRDDGTLQGIEAVIDKDYTAGILARELGADRFIILTDVDRVYRDFGAPSQEGLPVLACAEAERLLEEGEFPSGSMGPKVRTALHFCRTTGKEALITSADRLPEALAGNAGTRFVPDRREANIQ